MRILYCGEQNMKVMSALIHRGPKRGKTMHHERINEWKEEVKYRLNRESNPYDILDRLGIARDAEVWMRNPTGVVGPGAGAGVGAGVGAGAGAGAGSGAGAGAGAEEDTVPLWLMKNTGDAVREGVHTVICGAKTETEARIIAYNNSEEEEPTNTFKYDAHGERKPDYQEPPEDHWSHWATDDEDDLPSNGFWMNTTNEFLDIKQIGSVKKGTFEPIIMKWGY